MRRASASTTLAAGEETVTISGDQGSSVDVRNPKEKLVGHKDVRTTMIYTHVLNRGGRGVRRPADGLVRDPDER